MAAKTAARRQAAKPDAKAKTARKGQAGPKAPRLPRAEAGRRRPGVVKAINLALQGGGAHGAFTWGVLDRLLEDGRCFFEGVSGTSAGAFNAVALAAGLQAGGSEGAREKLEALVEVAPHVVDAPRLPGRLGQQGGGRRRRAVVQPAQLAQRLLPVL